MSISKKITIAEAKIQASLLLKSIRSSNTEKAMIALQRVKNYPLFQGYSSTSIIKTIKLKHTLDIIAIEHYYSDWRSLKNALEEKSSDDFVGCYVGGFLNHWFSSYQDAKAFQRAQGGYLLPYKKQFFVCDADYIRLLGLDEHDPDWKAIEYDWVFPTSKPAWLRLRKKLHKFTKQSKAS